MLKDQIDLLRAFNDHCVEYLVVGGHAVGYHSEPRGTKDLDLWIRSDEANSEAVYRALASFGAPLGGIQPVDFRGDPNSVIQFGVPPSRVDVLQAVSGLQFEDAWRNRVERQVEAGLSVPVISREDLIRNKEASGRLIDLADAEKLRASAEAEG